MAPHPKLGSRPTPPAITTDHDVLRELVNNADLLGHDSDRGVWLLVRTTPQLLEWLATMDAATENDEEGDVFVARPGRGLGDCEDDEPSAGPEDLEDDRCGA